MATGNYFKQINYSLGDEDSSVEYGMLEENAFRVGAIAGSGGRVIPLLAKFPNELFCIDILDEQVYLTQLRLEALKTFSYEEYVGFLGYPPFNFTSEKRRDYFYKLKLDPSAFQYLKKILEDSNWMPIIYYGKFEKTLIGFSKIIRAVMGKEVIKIFENNDLKLQQEYFKNSFPKKKWDVLTFILGNSTVLNSILYKGDFPKKNIPTSAFKHYKDIFERLFSSFLLKESFFLQLLFLGEMKYPEGNPIECDEHIFSKAQKAIESTKVNFRIGNVLTDLPKSLSYLSISDVPSFFKDKEEETFLNILSQYMAEDGLIVSRAHLRMPISFSNNFNLITDKYKKLTTNEKTQLWSFFVYQKKAHVHT